MDSYYGQTVLVTGASSGIGEAMARQLAFQQARLLLTARSEDKLEALAAEFRRAGAEAHVFAHDLGEAGAAEALYERVTEAGHEVDVLINNAGFGYVGPFADQAAAGVEGMATLNMTALTVLTRLFLPAMAARGHGGVLNVASTASYQPIPLMSVYAATKAYVRSFSEALAAEVRDSGVAVTCLCPGPTATAFADEAGMSDKFFRVAETAEKVASVGLDALLQGKRTVVSGLTNKVGAVASRLVPTGPTLTIARRIIETQAMAEG
ncbi:MAG: SDR family oxidoreductase [Bacteroidota bacterium]